MLAGQLFFFINKNLWLFMFAGLLFGNAYAESTKTNDAPVQEQMVITGQQNSLTNEDSTTTLLRKQGVEFSSGGGISGLPVLRGMNDDRVKLLIDGAEITSACANHMNPALSYIDVSRISSVEVIAGITPVSEGGDSIAGTVIVESEPPRYAESEHKRLNTGIARWFYSSNNHLNKLALTSTYANERSSLTYSGSYDDADSYRDAQGDKVLDTLYRAESHNFTLGTRSQESIWVMKLSHHEVPFQGFPNQYMDMVDNNSNSVNLQYLREFAWGQLETRFNWQDIEHAMGFFSEEKTGMMPMQTEGRDVGYKIAATIPLNGDGVLRLGNEYHQFRLDDWWPAVPNSMMMGPNDYININNGERTRYAFYAEADMPLSSSLQTLFGMRYERVHMQTDEVQPYNNMPTNPDVAAASAFNQSDRERDDNNVDITALLRYQAQVNVRLELGYARKTRSPNLYERYSWGRSNMAMTMLGWFGDGNAYVGDIALEPEVAHTLSASFQWLEANGEPQLSFTPWYTLVDNFIDVRQIGSFNPRMAMQVTRPQLQFSNLDARLYGLELHAQTSLVHIQKNALQLQARATYTRGERDAGGDLYHIMPLNFTFTLEHQLHHWGNRLEVEWIDSKKHVDPLRLESTSNNYTLTNLYTQYQWRNVELHVGVRNLFDRAYDLPLGGVYLAGWLAEGATGQFRNLPGAGRAVDAGITYSF